MTRKKLTFKPLILYHSRAEEGIAENLQVQPCCYDSTSSFWIEIFLRILIPFAVSDIETIISTFDLKFYHDQQCQGNPQKQKCII